MYESILSRAIMIRVLVHWKYTVFHVQKELVLVMEVRFVIYQAVFEFIEMLSLFLVIV